MKWNNEQKVMPEFGSERLTFKFAFLPRLCNHKHWLETVLIRQWRGSISWWSYVLAVCPESDEGKAFLNMRSSGHDQLE